jgi:uncharacterized DUF497 family protein
LGPVERKSYELNELVTTRTGQMGNSSFGFGDHTSFNWDTRKNEINKQKHGIDFDDAVEVFYKPILLRRSDRNTEERWVAIGYSENRLIAVVFAQRNDVIRIISARRARKNEEREYRNEEMERPP